MIKARLAKASVAFGRLYKNVCNRRGITTETKTKVYRAVILNTLLYSCEAWTVYQRYARKISHNQPPKVTEHKMSGEDTRHRGPHLPSVFTMFNKSQLCWAGYIVRMADHLLLKKQLFDELQEGKRSRGAPEKRLFNDSLKGLPRDIHHRP